MSEENIDDLDDFGFDDWDDEAPSGDFDLGEGVESHGKGPVDGAASTFAKSARDAAIDPAKIRETLDGVLPSKITGNIDLVTDAKDTLSEYLEDEFEKNKGDVRTVVDAIHKRIPEGRLSNMITGLREKVGLDDDDSYTEDKVDYMHTSDMNAALDDMFEKQASIYANTASMGAATSTAEAVERAQDRAEDRASKSLDLATSSSMARSLEELSSYNRNVTLNYQRKSLELRYKQFYTQQELLRISGDYFKSSFKLLEEIRHNAGLSDFRKTNLEDRLLKDTRGKGVDAFVNKLLGSNSRAARFVGKGVDGAVKLKDKVMSGIGMASMGIGAIDQAAEMEAMEASMSGIAPKSKSVKASGMVGGMVSGGLISLLGKLITPDGDNEPKEASRLSKALGIDKASLYAKKKVASGVSAYNNSERSIYNYLQDNEVGENDGMWTKVVKGAKRGVSNMAYEDEQATPSIETKAFDHNEVISYNAAANISITKIIPGLLTKVVRATNLMAGITDNQLEWDWNKGSFESVKTLNHKASKELYRAGGVEAAATDIDKAITDIQDKGAGLSEKEIEALRNTLFDDVFNRQDGGIGIKSYKDLINYGGRDKSHSKKFKTDPRTYAELQAKLQGMKIDDNQANKIDDLLANIGSGIDQGDVIASLEGMNNRGYGDVIAGLSYVDKGDNGSLSFNKKAFRDKLRKQFKGLSKEDLEAIKVEVEEKRSEDDDLEKGVSDIISGVLDKTIKATNTVRKTRGGKYVEEKFNKAAKSKQAEEFKKTASKYSDKAATKVETAKKAVKAKAAEYDKVVRSGSVEDLGKLIAADATAAGVAIKSVNTKENRDKVNEAVSNVVSKGSSASKETLKHLEALKAAHEADPKNGAKNYIAETAKGLGTVASGVILSPAIASFLAYKAVAESTIATEASKLKDTVTSDSRFKKANKTANDALTKANNLKDKAMNSEAAKVAGNKLSQWKDKITSHDKYKEAMEEASKIKNKAERSKAYKNINKAYKDLQTKEGRDSVKNTVRTEADRLKDKATAKANAAMNDLKDTDTYKESVASLKKYRTKVTSSNHYTTLKETANQIKDPKERGRALKDLEKGYNSFLKTGKDKADNLRAKTGETYDKLKTKEGRDSLMVDGERVYSSAKEAAKSKTASGYLLQSFNKLADRSKKVLGDSDGDGIDDSSFMGIMKRKNKKKDNTASNTVTPEKTKEDKSTNLLMKVLGGVVGMGSSIVSALNPLKLLSGISSSVGSLFGISSMVRMALTAMGLMKAGTAVPTTAGGDGRKSKGKKPKRRLKGGKLAAGALLLGLGYDALTNTTEGAEAQSEADEGLDIGVDDALYATSAAITGYQVSSFVSSKVRPGRKKLAKTAVKKAVKLGLSSLLKRGLVVGGGTAAAVLGAPLVAAGIAVAGAAWLAYDVYTLIAGEGYTMNSMDEIRYTEYGFNYDSMNQAQKDGIRSLEALAIRRSEQNLPLTTDEVMVALGYDSVGQGSLSFVEKVKASVGMLENKGYGDELVGAISWYRARFTPVLNKHSAAIESYLPGVGDVLNTGDVSKTDRPKFMSDAITKDGYQAVVKGPFGQPLAKPSDTGSVVNTLMYKYGFVTLTMGTNDNKVSRSPNKRSSDASSPDVKSKSKSKGKGLASAMLSGIKSGVLGAILFGEDSDTHEEPRVTNRSYGPTYQRASMENTHSPFMDSQGGKLGSRSKVGSSYYDGKSYDIDGAMRLTVEVANIMGLNPNGLLAIVAIESDFRQFVKNPGKGQTAGGLAQVIDSTWEMWMKKWGKKLNIPPDATKYNAKAALMLAAMNIRDKIKSKGYDNVVELYLCHFRGDGGGPALIKLYKNKPYAPVSGAGITGSIVKVNGSYFPQGVRTPVTTLYARILRAMESRAKKYGFPFEGNILPKGVSVKSYREQGDISKTKNVTSKPSVFNKTGPDALKNGSDSVIPKNDLDNYLEKGPKGNEVPTTPMGDLGGSPYLNTMDMSGNVNAAEYKPASTRDGMVTLNNTLKDLVGLAQKQLKATEKTSGGQALDIKIKHVNENGDVVKEENAAVKPTTAGSKPKPVKIDTEVPVKGLNNTRDTV